MLGAQRAAELPLSDGRPISVMGGGERASALISPLIAPFHRS